MKRSGKREKRTSFLFCVEVREKRTSFLFCVEVHTEAPVTKAEARKRVEQCLVDDHADVIVEDISGELTDGSFYKS